MIRITKLQIPGLPTEKARRLYVYLPKDYDESGRRYPVLYMFDGHNVFYNSHATYGKSWGMKEYLEKTRLPLIVVAIACNPEGHRRLEEYSPWDFSCGELGRLRGQGKLTMDWIAGSLKPEIDRTYRTLPDRAHTLIAGSSMGGLMALYAATAYNDVFSKAAALSPTLWISRAGMKALIDEKKPLKDTRIYMDLGDAEEPPAFQQRMSVYLMDTAGQLTRAGAAAAARIVPGGQHNEAAWEKRIPVFMQFLLE